MRNQWSICAALLIGTFLIIVAASFAWTRSYDAKAASGLHGKDLRPREIEPLTERLLAKSLGGVPKAFRRILPNPLVSGRRRRAFRGLKTGLR